MEKPNLDPTEPIPKKVLKIWREREREKKIKCYYTLDILGPNSMGFTPLSRYCMAPLWFLFVKLVGWPIV